MEPILEFNANFDDEEYIINIQTKPDLLNITIELESKSLYWSKTLDSKTLSDITSQMGSYKSLKVFSDMLIQALSKRNDSLSLNFCSLNEIQQLSGSNDIQTNNDENNIKKYLMMIYTSFEKVVYPIQMEFLGNNPNKELLQRTISRLKNKITKLKNESVLNNSGTYRSNNSYGNFVENIPINYNEFERLKSENEALISKIKVLQSKSVNDDIFKKYNELSEKYDTYKKMMENKMKLLVTSLEELKEKETQSYLQEKENEKNKLNSKSKNNISKIAELEKKLEISSEQLLNERKQNSRILEDKNREIDSLKNKLDELQILNSSVKMSERFSSESSLGAGASVKYKKPWGQIGVGFEAGVRRSVSHADVSANIMGEKSEESGYYTQNGVYATPNVSAEVNLGKGFSLNGNVDSRNP